MARPLRVEYKGAVYHITSRGNERKEIFLCKRDYEHFIKLLEESSNIFQVELISYCLMPNHYHLLIRTKEANLSRFMQRLNTSHTVYFNFKHKRVGHLLQGRYKAIVVESNDYLLVLSSYIHLNPVKVERHKNKSVKDKLRLLREYEWSSYLSLLDPGKRLISFNCEKVLDYMGGDTEKGRKKYEGFVLESLARETKSPMKEVKGQLVLGSEEFTEWVTDNFIKGKDLEPYPHLKEMKAGKEIKKIALEVAADYGLKAEAILKPKSKHREARNLLIELSCQANIRKLKLGEIGKELGGISGQAVGYIHSMMLKNIKADKKLKDRLVKLGTRLSILST